MLAVIGGIIVAAFLGSTAGRLLVGGTLVLLSQSFIGMLIVLIIIKMMGN